MFNQPASNNDNFDFLDNYDLMSFYYQDIMSIQYNHSHQKYKNYF